ncbi:hypothetical protein [Streptomyces sp. YIM S03343]
MLAARGEIDFRSFLFANVGDESEHPATLAYAREIAIPYAAGGGNWTSTSSSGAAATGPRKHSCSG